VGDLLSRNFHLIFGAIGTDVAFPSNYILHSRSLQSLKIYKISSLCRPPVTPNDTWSALRAYGLHAGPRGCLITDQGGLTLRTIRATCIKMIGSSLRHEQSEAYIHDSRGLLTGEQALYPMTMSSRIGMHL
jgi:hypothetical protein